MNIIKLIKNIIYSIVILTIILIYLKLYNIINCNWIFIFIPISPIIITILFCFMVTYGIRLIEWIIEKENKNE